MPLPGPHPGEVAGELEIVQQPVGLESADGCGSRGGVVAPVSELAEHVLDGTWTIGQQAHGNLVGSLDIGDAGQRGKALLVELFAGPDAEGRYDLCRE